VSVDTLSLIEGSRKQFIIPGGPGIILAVVVEAINVMRVQGNTRLTSERYLRWEVIEPTYRLLSTLSDIEVRQVLLPQIVCLTKDNAVALCLRRRDSLTFATIGEDDDHVANNCLRNCQQEIYSQSHTPHRDAPVQGRDQHRLLSLAASRSIRHVRSAKKTKKPSCISVVHIPGRDGIREDC
jgi:hypothetical protein